VAALQVIFTTSQWHYPPRFAGIQSFMNLLKVNGIRAWEMTSAYVTLLGCQIISKVLRGAIVHSFSFVK